MNKARTSIIILMIGTVISKALGLVREMMMANKYGASIITDSYVLGLSVPMILFTSVATAVLINYIPIYTEIDKHEPEKTGEFNGKVVNIVLMFVILTIGIYFLFPNFVIRLVAFGFDLNQVEYVRRILNISIFSIGFIQIGYILKGYLEYKGRFFPNAINGIIFNFGLIFGILISNTERFYLLGFGILLGYFLNFVVQIIYAKKMKFKYTPKLNFKDKHLKKMLLLSLPILFNDAIWHINVMIGQSITSTLGSGYISALNYAQYVTSTITMVIAVSVATVIFPKITKLFSDGNKEAIKNHMRTVFKNIIVICLPLTTFIFVMAGPIIKILFFRGEFNQESFIITSGAAAIYAFGLLFASLKTVIVLLIP